MTSVTWGILLVLTVPLSLVIAALVTPVKIDFAIRTSPRWHLTIAARLFAGLLPPIRILDSDRRQKKKVEKRNTKPKKSFHKSMPVRRMVSSGPKLIRGILTAIRIERLKLEADVGLNDPADAGHIYGLLTPLIYSIPPASTVSIAIKPDFSSARLSGHANGLLHVVPVTLIPPIARFAWHAFGRRS